MISSLVMAFVLITLNCRSRSVIVDKGSLAQVDKLNQFFSACEKDIRSATDVIIKNDIIRTLTHLQRMNDGGRKYYLLERENLTSMIRAVTEGVYTDLILVNGHGTVIYTMTNDGIFGKSAERNLMGSAVYDCFIKSKMGSIHIEDVTIFPPVIGSLNMFVSLMDVQDKFSRGVFIMQIDISLIENILGENAVVIDRQGKYRFTAEREKIFSPCPFFKKIDQEGLDPGGKKIFTYEDKEYLYSPFKFANLFWIIITPLSL